MKMLRKLANPMALVAQGFVLGAALFFATHPRAGEAVAELSFAQTPAVAAAPGS